VPIFHYRGIDRSGRSVVGVMEAVDEAGLEERLKGIGYWLVDASPQRRRGAALSWVHMFSRINRRDLIEFCTQMSAQTKAGVPLVQALEVAIEECTNPRFLFVLEGLLRNIESGSLMYEAMDKYPEAFSPHIVSLVRAGELSGKLAETFLELRKYLEWLDHTISDFRQASIYPLVVVSVMSLFVLFLFTFVIPRFIRLMEVTRAPLPFLTQIVFGLSNSVRSTWWVWLLLIFSATIGVQIVRRTSRGFALWYDRAKLKIPAFGELNQMIALSRFAHNLGVMYRSGIPILQSLRLCQGLVGNAAVEMAIKDVEQSISGGDTISEAMSRHNVFPSMLMRMVILGETTGNLDEALENVSQYYNDTIPRRIKKIFSIMEPVLMLSLIFLVGTVALSIFLPMISLITSIQR
jgi:type II secretory pathway component PulF